MNSNKRFDNEKLKNRTTYLLWLFLAVAGVIGFQILNPIIKPHRYSGSITEWVFTIAIILILIGYFIFYKRFVSITFDYTNNAVILLTTTLIAGTHTRIYNYAGITFEHSKELARFRKKPTQFIEVFNETKKVIKLERISIGDVCFDNILKELQQLKKSP